MGIELKCKWLAWKCKNQVLPDVRKGSEAERRERMKFDDEICKGVSCHECSFNKGEDGCLLAERLDEIDITPEPCEEHTETHSCENKCTETHDWIPVTERLPEDIRPVIVTWKNNDPESYYQNIVGKHFIGVAHFKGGKWYWYSSTTEDFLAEYGRYDGEEFDEAIEVVAWCELPEPYAERKEDE